jgi:hypothetical protein
VQGTGSATESLGCEPQKDIPMNRTFTFSLGGLILLIVIVAILF